MDKNDSYQSNFLSRLYEKPIAWWQRISGGLPLWLFPIAGIFGVLWLWLLFDTTVDLFHLTEGVPGAEHDANRTREQAILFAVGIIGALLAAIIVPVRLSLLNRQTQTAEQGLITDRLTKAIEQLGAEKTVKGRSRTVYFTQILPRKRGPSSEEEIEFEGDPFVARQDQIIDNYGPWETYDKTVPNLEVRLGAIYALERIAQDSERDHIPIMETLCAYIRENAPASSARDDSFSSPRVDVQTALKVIGQRHPERIAYERLQGHSSSNRRAFCLDLRGTNLRAAQLEGLDYCHALFDRARLENADFSGARLERANLQGARLERARLWSTGLEGANLKLARLEGAQVWDARLADASLMYAALGSVDFRLVHGLSQTAILLAFGDAQTRLPDGVRRPDHWHRGDDTIDYDEKYRAWLDGGGSPGAPVVHGGDGSSRA